MIYKIAISDRAQAGIDKHKKSGNKSLVQKIFKLLLEVAEHPRTGTGQIEHLKGYTDREMWSRRIDQKHRLVYEIKDDELIVIAVSTYGHYDDK